MRISGGDARGVRLKVPAGARPASERVRLAIFSSLAARVPGARVLDLYCGSGAYGLEALSRGADAAVFVDRDVRTARDNARAAGLEPDATFVRGDVSRYLAGCRDSFDLAFADAPYDDDVPVERIPADTIVVERRWSKAVPDTVAGYVLEADRRYGDTRVLVFKRERS